MSNVLKSSGLINSIKRKSMLPIDQVTFTDQDILDMLNEEIQYFGIPHLMSTHEDYLVVSEDITLEENKQSYTIPYRAVGNKLRDVFYVDSSDGIRELHRISLEDIADYDNRAYKAFTDAFYVQNNKIYLVGTNPGAGSKLRMYYYLRPNKLVDEDRVAVISDINRTSGVVTVEHFPAIFSSGPEIDFIQSKTPNKIHTFDKTPLSVDSNTKSFTFNVNDLPEDLEVGDYINLSGECVVPQLPTELHAVLAQRVSVALLEALGDQQALATAQGRLDKMEMSTKSLIDDRVEGAPQKINNRHGLLRGTLSKVINRNKRF